MRVMRTVHTVLGPVPADQLGVTLMHEHLLIGWPGWEWDAASPRASLAELAKICTERMLEIKAHGVQTLVDPCPMDLGRDVELMARVSQDSGVHIICATGLYKEDQGATAYFKFRQQFADATEEIRDAFVREITEGVGCTGIKPGVIKAATGAHQITPYEETVLRAAAQASCATGTPITTHTDEGTMGREQLDIFAAEGVDLRHVIIGHSCGTADLRYHVDLLDRGCFIGFDRFGLEILQPDRLRLAALIGLLGVGFAKQIVLSHDSVWCWRGRPLPLPETVLPHWRPTYLFTDILPRLREAGVSEDKIHTMLVLNPRRFFS
ncbi:MAG: phosphotriesterase [Candidatus Binatia bacterium]|nr:MAG: phosphotriesterase [Candidatus Binatia bacterium]